MWNDKKSIILSKICVVLFMVLLAALAVCAPWVVRVMFAYAAFPGYVACFLVTVYTGCIPAGLLLVSLFRLLLRIGRGEIFIQKNVDALRLISWCCFAGAVVSAASAVYYISWVMVAVAAAFMALIVRVVKNCFARAVSLQDDADYTI